MALILAIEPDRRQAGQLTAIVKGRLHAEFVIGDSAETALAALGSRVPDLVLTTALLSPKDESALSERLRALDGAAAHVQTLTIPVLATSSRRRDGGKAGGVLSALLGDKSKTTDSLAADGCDPAMFAEQCKEYLERATAERAAAVEENHTFAEEAEAPVEETFESFDSSASFEPEPPAELSATETAAEATDVHAAELTVPMEMTVEAPAEALVEAPVEAPDAPVDVPVEMAVEAQVESPAQAEHRSFASDLIEDEPPAALLAAVAALAEEDEQALYAPAPAQATPPEFVVEEPRPRSEDRFDFDLSSILDDGRGHAAAPAAEDEPHVPVHHIEATDFDRAPFELEGPVQPASDNAVYTPLATPDARTWPILDGLTTTAVDEDTRIDAAPRATAGRSETVDLTDWKDIIEALRRDAQPAARPDPAPLETLEASVSGEIAEPIPEPMLPEANETVTAPAMETAEASEPEAAAADPALLDPSRRKLRRKTSAEDEWGLFDPDKAGFAALLAKLEEITEDDSRKPRRT